MSEMFATASAVSLVLAALLLFSAGQKLSRSPTVVDGYRRVGVVPERLPHLAATLLAGTAGLLVGLAWAPLGVTAAAGLVAYFLVAIGAHLRHGEMGNIGTPMVMLVLAAAALVLRLESM